jgi:hypothetical protein
MGIIHRAISTHIVNRAGFSNKQAKTGAVTLQRYGASTRAKSIYTTNLTRTYGQLANTSGFSLHAVTEASL